MSGSPSIVPKASAVNHWWSTVPYCQPFSLLSPPQFAFLPSPSPINPANQPQGYTMESDIARGSPHVSWPDRSLNQQADRLYILVKYCHDGDRQLYLQAQAGESSNKREASLSLSRSLHTKTFAHFLPTSFKNVLLSLCACKMQTRIKHRDIIQKVCNCCAFITAHKVIKGK